jgi:uncharacterized protein (DUF1697 family)
VISYVALLRAVNVGGRQLRMTDMKSLAEQAGLGSPRTYIASGNLLFTSARPESEVKRELETAIGAHMGKPVEVMIRTAAELAEALARNPFADEPGNRVVAIFLDHAPDADALAAAKNVAEERLALGTREIYVHFPTGQGQSKLAFPARLGGTGRNMNTVARLAELARNTT